MNRKQKEIFTRMASFFLGMLFFVQGAGILSAGFLQDGESALASGEWEDAVLFLEAALAESPESRAYLLLSLAHEGQGQRTEALRVLEEGVQGRGSRSPELHFNLGILRASSGDAPGAEEAYTQALRLDTTFSNAVLNRANLRLQNRNWEGALGDYQSFLSLEPNHVQAPEIQRLLPLLARQIQVQAEQDRREEALRLAEEARRQREEELRRQEEEQRQRLEAERLAMEEAQRQQEEELRRQREEEERLLEQERQRQEEERRQLEEERQRQEAELLRMEEERRAEEERRRQEEILRRIRESLEGASRGTQVLGAGDAGIEGGDDDFMLED